MQFYGRTYQRKRARMMRRISILAIFIAVCFLCFFILVGFSKQMETDAKLLPIESIAPDAAVASLPIEEKIDESTLPEICAEVEELEIFESQNTPETFYEKVENQQISTFSSSNGTQNREATEAEENEKESELLFDSTEYVEVMEMLSTPYCHCEECCDKTPEDAAYGLTYTGIDLLDGNEHKVIAVDPDVIPLGSKVYVEVLEVAAPWCGEFEDYGYAIAGDIGGGIDGNRIDAYFPSHEEAWAWKVTKVRVYILEYPTET